MFFKLAEISLVTLSAHGLGGNSSGHMARMKQYSKQVAESVMLTYCKRTLLPTD